MPNSKSPRNCGQKKFLNGIGALYTAFQARPYVFLAPILNKALHAGSCSCRLYSLLSKYISILIQIEYKNYKHDFN